MHGRRLAQRVALTAPREYGPHMAVLRYRTVHEQLIEALPELLRPYQRLFDDWDDFGGEPPGQYHVFADLLGTMLEVLLSLPGGTSGRDELLGRALRFAEQMLGSESGEVHGLAMDAVAETLNNHPAGLETAERLGGPQLKRWFGAAGRRVPGAPDDEIIDLWGVRAEVEPLLPTIELPQVPGISHPAKYLALPTLAEAQGVEDAAVLLSAYGTTRPYVIARANAVHVSEERLREVAEAIAVRFVGDDQRGRPDVHLRRIPRDERVWNMNTGNDHHTRLGDEPWIADGLSPIRPVLLDALVDPGVRLDLDESRLRRLVSRSLRRLTR